MTHGCKSVKLDLPFPPTLNHDIGANRLRRYRTREYQNFIETVGLIWKINRSPIWDADATYFVTIWFAYNSRRRWDTDNRIKPLFDALTHAGAWRDDSQIDDYFVRKFKPVKGAARCYVRITRLDTPAQEIPDFCDF